MQEDYQQKEQELLQDTTPTNKQEPVVIEVKEEAEQQVDLTKEKKESKLVDNKDGFTICANLGEWYWIDTVGGNAHSTAAMAYTFERYVFIAPRPCRLVWVAMLCPTAATSGDKTLDVLKAPPGTTPSNGTTMLAAKFSTAAITTTANIKNGKELTSSVENLSLAIGDAVTVAVNGAVGLTTVFLSMHFVYTDNGDYKDDV